MPTTKAPTPLLSTGEPVDWFFAFKFNSATYPGGTLHGKPVIPGTPGIFGGHFLDYIMPSQPRQMRHSQQYAIASSKHPTLVKRNDDCIGTSENDPLGATFSQVYFSDDLYYIIWNDQFHGNPGGDSEYPLGSYEKGVWKAFDIPWGHSKGMLAWNNEGEGFVLQVSTPSWPASGNHKHPRKNDGNTLGCINDDDVEVSQHFFCLKINAADLETILKALQNSSVITDPNDPQIARLGGPQKIKELASSLGKLSHSKEITMATLSSGVQLISKPSLLNCPPWQLVSSKLGGLPLLVASWWVQGNGGIESTDKDTLMVCWPEITNFPKPGPVEIAISGTWDKITIGLKGSPSPNGNHAKIGVSTGKNKPLVIFADMNQTGALKPTTDPRHSEAGDTCAIHQNGRGGLFYVVDNQSLHTSIKSLITNEVAGMNPTKT